MPFRSGLRLLRIAVTHIHRLSRRSARRAGGVNVLSGAKPEPRPILVRNADPICSPWKKSPPYSSLHAGHTLNRLISFSLIDTPLICAFKKIISKLLEAVRGTCTADVHLANFNASPSSVKRYAACVCFICSRSRNMYVGPLVISLSHCFAYFSNLAQHQSYLTFTLDFLYRFRIE